MQRTLGDAAEVRVEPFDDVLEGIDARLAAVTSSNTIAAGQIQQLMNFGENALVGADEEEEGGEALEPFEEPPSLFEEE